MNYTQQTWKPSKHESPGVALIQVALNEKGPVFKSIVLNDWHEQLSLI